MPLARPVTWEKLDMRHGHSVMPLTPWRLKKVTLAW